MGLHALILTPVQTADAAVAEQLQTIVWAQVAMAVVMVLCALAVLGAAVAVLLLARRAIKTLEETRTQLLPHVTPILSRATGIADDVREITTGVRDEADTAREVVRDLLDRSRNAADSLEERVRRFGIVMDVVQDEAEALLMDAAATARGVSTAARALREDGPDAPRASAAGATPTPKDGNDHETRPIR